ncbi:PDDEXK-like family protein [Cognataquiflexum aquatile]|uniref:PDDEXK-like family protein n=1 Tax=Cognataquiflexum aquatile TaxID=2249427 RepID=UPI000DEB8447|nr:PD-(D/E)XK nuclease family protein [Cognataquiflexum aquatile]
MDNVRNLITQAGLIVKNHEKSYASTGQAFSFIHACNLLYYETVLHNKFIGYLLNPKAGHFQKDKFLKLFLKELDLESESTSDFQVTVEKSIGKVDWDQVEGGRIDILIESSKVAYAIEVKIFAGEQIQQLERYKNYLRKISGSENSKVIFLTLEGNNSGVHGKFKDYVPISFSNHILSWIEKCRLGCIDQPVIRETLTQYLAGIKTLTNQNPDNQMSEEIIDIITRDEFSFKAFNAINSAHNKLFQKFGENLIKAIKMYTDLETKFNIELSKKIIPNSDAEVSFYLKESTTQKVMLYWLGNGVVAIGMHLGHDHPDEKIRKAMKIKLSNLKSVTYTNRLNWAWFSEIEELKNQPQLTFDSWEKFKSKDLADKIAGWVKEISAAYKEAISEE